MNVGFSISGYLLLAILYGATPAIAVAEETISVPFTAVGEELEKPVHKCCQKNWSIGAEVTYGNIRMGEMNDYLSWMDSIPGNDVDEFDHAAGLGLFLSYFTNKYIGVELGYEKIAADVSGRTNEGNFKAKTSAEGVLASVVLSYPLNLRSLSVEGKIGAGYYVADYEEEENGVKWFTWDDSDIGFKVSTTMNYCLTENVSMYVGGGYRYLIFDKFDIPLSVPRKDVEVDFSGVFATIGLKYGWHW